MISLGNDQLDVAILHPVEDRHRLGSRYCTGGYVYQVTDRKLGDLVSGPGYPSESDPLVFSVFDGQGLPEVFRDTLWEGMVSIASHARPPLDTEMLVIGVGRVHLKADFRRMPVDEFAAWEIAEEPGRVTMRSRQEFAGWAIELTRTLTLTSRTLVSTTRLANDGGKVVPYWWYPHPFFPLVLGESSRFSRPVTMQADRAYELMGSDLLSLRAEAGWDRHGNHHLLEFEPGERLVVVQRHPKLGHVTVTFNYPTTYCPIWGNMNTFSFEPYAEGSVAQGSSAEWSVRYDFQTVPDPTSAPP